MYCILMSEGPSPTKLADCRFCNCFASEGNYTKRAVLKKGAGWRKINRGGALEQISASKRELDAITREQKKLLKDAKSELNRVTKEREKQIKDCESKMGQARDVFYGHVQTLGNIVLYGDRIVAEAKSIPLSDNLEIEVNSSGNVYSETTVSGGGTSVTGAVVGGVVAGPLGAVVGGRKGVKSKSEVQDERKLFISIVSSIDSAVVELDPKMELGARKLVAETKKQIKTLSSRKEKMDAELAELTQRLVMLEEDTGAIDEARSRFEEQEIKSASVIEDAKARHEAIKNSFDQSQIEEEKKAQRSANVRKIAMGLGFTFGALLFLLGVFWLTSAVDGAAFGTVSLLLADFLLVKSFITLRDSKAEEKDGE